ncbi:MAG: MGMT family protein [Syntrophales bacterium]|nr:MGMT family protein [Syntrophales bacterium]
MRFKRGIISDEFDGPFYCRRLPSVFGFIEIFWRGDNVNCSVISIRLPGAPPDAGLDITDESGVAIPSSLEILEKEIKGSFEGSFLHSPSINLLDLSRCHEFQRRVLVGTRSIPRGMTVSYGELAFALGFPGAARAMGTALARNPFPVVFPCHRVIRSSGDVGLFGGGSFMKEALLRREGVIFDGPMKVAANCRLKLDSRLS